MRPAPTPRLALALLGLALGAGCLVRAGGDEGGIQAARRAAPPRVVPGLAPEQVEQRLGPPPRISRQVFLLRCLEQWHYGAPHHLRLTFSCPRGRKPTLQSVHELVPPNR
jgi:hypothetical protein